MPFPIISVVDQGHRPGTYVNVFDEFCKVYEGPATTGRPAAQVGACAALGPKSGTKVTPQS